MKQELAFAFRKQVCMFFFPNLFSSFCNTYIKPGCEPGSREQVWGP